MLEFKLRPVTRHVLTRYERTEHSGSCETLGEFANRQYAEEIGSAIANQQGGTFSSNILPGHEPQALLRNIAEQSDIDDGVVVLRHKDGAVTVYGLGLEGAAAFELLEAGREELERLAKLQ